MNNIQENVYFWEDTQRRLLDDFSLWTFWSGALAIAWGHIFRLTANDCEFLSEEIHEPELFTKVLGLYFNKDCSAVRGRRQSMSLATDKKKRKKKK